MSVKTIERYNPRVEEPRWQKAWDEAQSFVVRDDDPRPRYYVLEMSPYPSGRIHMGHVRNYAMGDVLARYMRMRGKNVLHPMGWDAFGMPAENAAMERGVHPGTWTWQNIGAMKAQLKTMGLSLDWSREIATCDPSYYRHQQAMFLDFLGAGLVTRKQSKVNWDPVDMTVLANEQVIDGRGWRSGALVEQRELTQWSFKISDYAEELLAAIDTLEHWPDKVRVMQRNWIGKSEGLRLLFECEGDAPERTIEVFTTRPDTIFGASFIALSPDHPLTATLAARDPSLADFVEECHRMGTATETIDKAEKKGHFTGLRVKHPVKPGETLPVYVANFVLMEYGAGAIFGCPAHDQRDLDFAASTACRSFRWSSPDADAQSFSVGDEAMSVPAPPSIPSSWTGCRSRPPRRPSPSTLPVEPSTAARRVSSRPTTGCATGAFHASATGDARSRSSTARSAAPCPSPNRTCRCCCPRMSNFRRREIPRSPPDMEACPLSAMRRAARRETDTMDTFVDSSWYFAASPPRTRKPQRFRARRTPGCRSTSISAASSTPSCTCFTRASSPAR